jgi:transposase InsO family protein
MSGAGEKHDVKAWFTSAELAALALPGLSKAKRKINEKAAAECWALREDGGGQPLARPRAGRGGGLEYHVDLLPAVARLELVRRGMVVEGAEQAAKAPQTALTRSWAWFEGQSAKVKAEAEHRAAIIARVEAYEAGRLTRSTAIALVASEANLASSTLWGWLSQIEGVDACDRLPHLAPRRQGGGAEAEVDAGAWQFLISDYLRPEKPTFASCYQRCLVDYAEPRGLQLPHRKTLYRKLEREIDGRLLIARREGAEALRRTLPPQQRTVAASHAMALVNIDGHKWDVFVRFPDGRIARPIMVAIQDVFSRKILSWRIDQTENAVLTRLAFADLFRDHGIPAGCLMDNGRAFASKWITGGAATRFRFKIKAEEPTGLLTALGVRIHWATPYRGQSKPIERAFRDLCDSVAKHPSFAGAYTGNRPDAKPENYGSKAIDFDLFQAVVKRGIEMHNAKLGRRTETAHGQSFDDVFAASYAASPIGRATPEQLRMALLTAEELRADRATGAITLMGNRYWAPEMAQLAGQKITVRFDPDDLTQSVHVYDKAGRFLATAPVWEQTGFLDAGAARARARLEGDLKKAVKRQEEVADLLRAEELARLIPAHDDEQPEPLQPTIVRPVRHRGMTAAALKSAPVATPTAAPAPTPMIDRFAQAVRHLRVVED